MTLKNYDGVIDVILDLSLISPNFGLGWYLSYLLLWYVVFWVLHRFIGNKNARLILLGIVTIGFMVYFGITSGIRFEQSFAFPIGVVMANYEEQSKKFFKSRIVVGLLATGAILLGLKQTSYVRNMSEMVINILNLVMKESVGIGLVMGVVVIEEMARCGKEKELICKVLTPIGLASYELYLVHGYALKIFELDYTKWLLVAVFIGISVTGTTVLYFVDKTIAGGFKKKIY